MTPCHAVKLTATGLPWSRWTTECMVGESASFRPQRPAQRRGTETLINADRLVVPLTQRLGAAEIRTNTKEIA